MEKGRDRERECETDRQRHRKFFGENTMTTITEDII